MSYQFPPAGPPVIAPPPKKPIYKRVWFWIVVVVVVLAIIGAINGAPGGSDDDPSDNPSTEAPTDPVTTDAVPETTAPPSEAPETTAPAEPAISNGDHLVGTGIAPGLYRCDVDTTAIIAYAAVTQTGSDGTIMDIRNASEGAVLFNISDVAGSVVNFQGCGWIGLADTAPRTGPFTNGDWLVGSELPAGTYQCAVDMTAMVAYAAVTQSAADGSILDIRNSAEGNVIFTVQDVPGTIVAFQGCASIAAA